ncbi:M48 family metalloprotease [Thermodesulfobacteriota bacterium]
MKISKIHASGITAIFLLSIFIEPGLAFETGIESVFEGNKITIIPQLSELTAGYVEVGDYEIYYIKTVSKIFFQDYSLDVVIDKVKTHKEAISLQLIHNVLGEGQIYFYFNKDNIDSITTDVLREAIFSSLSDENNLRVYLNKNSKYYHIKTCNHILDRDISLMLSIEEAKASGYRSCGFCFTKYLQLPEYLLEMTIARKAAAEIRHGDPVLIDEQKQTYIDKIGRRVLKQWPVMLIGYNYTFTIIKSPRIIAYAVPAGKVFITSALFEAIESEEELEAILAHEIAHIEKRHLLKTVHALEDKRNIINIASLFVGLTLGGISGATTDSSTTAAEIVSKNAAAMSMIGFAIINIYYVGYHKELEREADEMTYLYLLKRGIEKDRYDDVGIDAVNLFKKIEFANLCKIHDPDPESNTHSYIAERIDRAKHTNYHSFKENNNYIATLPSGYAVKLTLLYESIYRNEYRLAIYLDDHSVRDSKKVLLKIVDGDEERLFKCVKKATTKGVWGTYMVFTNKKTKKTKNISPRWLSNITKIEIRNAIAIKHMYPSHGTPEPTLYHLDFSEGSIIDGNIVLRNGSDL